MKFDNRNSNALPAVVDQRLKISPAIGNKWLRSLKSSEICFIGEDFTAKCFVKFPIGIFNKTPNNQPSPPKANEPLDRSSNQLPPDSQTKVVWIDINQLYLSFVMLLRFRLFISNASRNAYNFSVLFSNQIRGLWGRTQEFGTQLDTSLNFSRFIKLGKLVSRINILISGLPTQNIYSNDVRSILRFRRSNQNWHSLTHLVILVQFLFSVQSLWADTQVSRISSRIANLGSVQNLYMTPGLVTVLQLPTPITEVKVGSPDDVQVQISKTLPSEVSLIVKRALPQSTNLIVRCGSRSFVFDLVMSRNRHQDLVKVSGSYGAPIDQDLNQMSLIDSSAEVVSKNAATIRARETANNANSKDTNEMTLIDSSDLQEKRGVK